jgi:hypothetical protein
MGMKWMAAVVMGMKWMGCSFNGHEMDGLLL